MANIAISAPSVIINDVPRQIVPNTLSVTTGLGEIKVRAASGGGNSVTTIHTIDAETLIGKASF